MRVRGIVLARAALAVAISGAMVAHPAAQSVPKPLDLPMLVGAATNYARAVCPDPPGVAGVRQVLFNTREGPILLAHVMFRTNAAPVQAGPESIRAVFVSRGGEVISMSDFQAMFPAFVGSVDQPASAMLYHNVNYASRPIHDLLQFYAVLVRKVVDCPRSVQGDVMFSHATPASAQELATLVERYLLEHHGLEVVPVDAGRVQVRVRGNP